MTEAADRLVHRLDLSPGEGSMHWIGGAGENALNGNDALFGGLVVAQMIMAAGRSDPHRTVHSIQQVFLRAGRAEIPIHYVVDALFTGRTYAAVRVDARQQGRLISHAQVGLTAGIDGPDRQEPSVITTPLEATVNRDEFLQRPNWDDQPVEFRIDPGSEDDGLPSLDTWVRAAGPVEGDQLLHQALLGYASDRGLMRTGWKPHRSGGDFRGATLDHSIWFHRPLDMNEWHVYRKQGPTMADGRGLIHGSVHSAAGIHVATTVQQGTFRPRPR